jgi:hypothetical protein
MPFKDFQTFFPLPEAIELVAKAYCEGDSERAFREEILPALKDELLSARGATDTGGTATQRALFEISPYYWQAGRYLPPNNSLFRTHYRIIGGESDSLIPSKSGQTPSFRFQELEVRIDGFQSLWPKALKRARPNEVKEPRPSVTKRYSRAALEALYRRYVVEQQKAGKRPSRDDDWEAARRALGEGVPREAVRKVRRKLAPDDWKRPGRRKTGDK